MKNNRLYWGLGIVALLIMLFWLSSDDDEIERDITVEAFRADFEDLVTSSGELMAKNSENILGPPNLQAYGLYEVKISRLVSEGTYVDSGDFVAELDKTPLSSKLSEVFNELEKARSQYTQAKLDTSLELREKRSALESLEFDLRQKRVELRQSEYEPPATIQRLKLDLEKLEQTLEQNRENYQIKRQQSIAKMREAAATLAQAQNEYDELRSLEKDFRIHAPKKGMVIYYRSWRGTPRETGSTISPWNPTVATLPDLSQMESKTYINEVDIRKVETGQTVSIGLDAFPEAKLTGVVTRVANVGESRENSDSKVFEVIIAVNESDSTYRPGMTTSNQIITQKLEDQLQIPLEGVFSSGDTTFVYKSTGVGVQKQQVRLGPANDEFVIVEEGLKDKDEIYLTEPAAATKQELQKLANAD